MTKNKSRSRQAKRIVRMPATRFAHLQKRMKQRLQKGAPRAKP